MSTIGGRSTRATSASWWRTTVRCRSRSGPGTYHGLFGVEDAIDRGDSYDCDPDPVRNVDVRSITVRRTRHKSGIARLHVVRELDDIGTLTVEACVAPGVPFVRCEVTLDNRAPDHRLRLRFPTGADVDEFDAATTFDVDRRSTAPVDDAGWVHPAPRTFAHQGWIAANGLVVGAPGLPEAEVTPGGDVLVTLVRSVGALARIELRTRPLPAGPEMMTPGAQTQGHIARDGHARPRTPRTRARRRSVSAACSPARRRVSTRTPRCSGSSRSTRCCPRASPHRRATGSSCGC